MLRSKRKMRRCMMQIRKKLLRYMLPRAELIEWLRKTFNPPKSPLPPLQPQKELLAIPLNRKSPLQSKRPTIQRGRADLTGKLLRTRKRKKKSLFKLTLKGRDQRGKWLRMMMMRRKR